MTPTEPTFYLKFFSLVFLTAIVALVGGNNGIALGKLIQRNRWLTDSSVRLLRLGMWLPIFLLWSYSQLLLSYQALPPVLEVFPFSLASVNRRNLFLFFAGMLAMTTVLFGSCYHYLTRRLLTQSHHEPQFRLLLQHFRPYLWREIFLLALFVCLLWQSFWGNGWPFQLEPLLRNLIKPGDSRDFMLTTCVAMALLLALVFVNNRPFRWSLQLLSVLFAITIILFAWGKIINPMFMYPTVGVWVGMFLLMAVVLIANTLTRWSLDDAVSVRWALLRWELKNANSQSLLGVLILAGLGLFSWVVLSEPLAAYMLIPRPSNVIQAMFSMIVSGANATGPRPHMLWPDIRVSLVEIFAGITWAGLFAAPTVEWCYSSSWRKQGGALLALAFISPVVLYDPSLIWLGVNFTRRAFVVSCFAYFPMVQVFWSYKHLSMPSRVLLAIEESLPYAFVGMLVAEIVAKEGVGFFIMVASVTKQLPQAFAASIILFGFLVVISTILRRAVKQEVLQVPNTTTAAQPTETLDPAIESVSTDSMLLGIEKIRSPRP